MVLKPIIEFERGRSAVLLRRFVSRVPECTTLLRIGFVVLLFPLPTYFMALPYLFGCTTINGPSLLWNLVDIRVAIVLGASLFFLWLAVVLYLVAQRDELVFELVPLCFKHCLICTLLDRFMDLGIKPLSRQGEVLADTVLMVSLRLNSAHNRIAVVVVWHDP